MIDLAFAAFLADIGMGAGNRILDGLGQAPEHPLDAMALSLPLGLGLRVAGRPRTRRARLAQSDRPGGAPGRADGTGLVPGLRMFRDLGADSWMATIPIEKDPWRAASWPVCLAIVVVGTAMVATGPVTDGDALCYHLQVPKVFLMRGCGRVRSRPARDGLSPGDGDALCDRARVSRAGRVPLDPVGPRPGVRGQCDGDWRGPSLGRRAWWAGAIVLLAPAISNGMSAPLNDVALAAFGTAAIFAWTRLLDRPGGRRRSSRACAPGWPSA